MKKLIKKLNIGAIFVTHDKQDAFSISDKIALIKDGKVARYGSTKELYKNPKSLFVAKHMGKINLFTSDCIGLEKNV